MTTHIDVTMITSTLDRQWFSTEDDDGMVELVAAVRDIADPMSRRSVPPVRGYWTRSGVAYLLKVYEVCAVNGMAVTISSS